MCLNKTHFKTSIWLIFLTFLFWLGSTGCTDSQRFDSPEDISQLEDIQIEELLPEPDTDIDDDAKKENEDEEDEDDDIFELEAPQNIKVFPGFDEARITWDTVSGAERYVVHKASFESISDDPLEETEETLFIYRPTSRSFGLPHILTVKAISSVHGQSDFSEKVSFHLFSPLTSETETLTSDIASPARIKTAINGKNAAVGICNPGEPGKVYIYKYRIFGGWGIEQVIENEAAGFGCALDITEDYLVIGAPNQERTGEAYIYSKLADEWTLTHTLSPEPFIRTLALGEDKFGSAISINGDFILIGAPNTTVDEYSKAGVVYLFERQDIAIVPGTYTARFLKKYNSPQPQENARFGAAVELYIEDTSTSKDIALPGLSSEQQRLALIGEPLADIDEKMNAGKAYFFNFMDNGIITGHMHELSANNEAITNAHFGSSVSLTMPDPWYILVGAPGQEETLGSAFIFHKNEDGEVEKLTKISGPTLSAETKDLFGYDVLIKNIGETTMAFISAPGYEKGVLHAYIIRKFSEEELEEIRRRGGGIERLVTDTDDHEDDDLLRRVEDDAGIDGSFFADLAAILPNAVHIGGFEPADISSGSMVGASIAFDQLEFGLLISGPIGLAELPDSYPLVYNFNMSDLSLFAPRP